MLVFTKKNLIEPWACERSDGKKAAKVMKAGRKRWKAERAFVFVAWQFVSNGVTSAERLD